MAQVISHKNLNTVTVSMKINMSSMVPKIYNHLTSSIVRNLCFLTPSLPADSTRETGVLQAYFAAGAVKGIASACHDQKIRDCVCSLDGPVESTDEEGNLIYRDCSEDSTYSIDYVLNFIFPGLTVSIATERYNVNFQIVKNKDGSISTSIERTAIAAVDQPTAEPEPSEPYTRILNDVHNTVVGLKVRERASE